MLAALLFALLTPVPSPSTSPRLVARSHTVVGEVTAVAGERVTLRTAAAAAPETWVLPADVKVTRAGRVARVADLVPGTRVVLTCEDGARGEHHARAVRISASLPSPPPAR
jgi:hypothetical protein